MDADKTLNKTIKNLAANGLARADIARYTGLSEAELINQFDDVLFRGTVDANLVVSNFLFEMASGAAMLDGAKYADCLKAAQYWAKTRMNWEDGAGDDYQAPTEIIIRSGGPVE